MRCAGHAVCGNDKRVDSCGQSGNPDLHDSPAGGICGIRSGERYGSIDGAHCGGRRHHCPEIRGRTYSVSRSRGHRAETGNEYRNPDSGIGRSREACFRGVTRAVVEDSHRGGDYLELQGIAQYAQITHHHGGSPEAGCVGDLDEQLAGTRGRDRGRYPVHHNGDAAEGEREVTGGDTGRAGRESCAIEIRQRTGRKRGRRGIRAVRDAGKNDLREHLQRQCLRDASAKLIGYRDAERQRTRGGRSATQHSCGAVERQSGARERAARNRPGIGSKAALYVDGLTIGRGHTACREGGGENIQWCRGENLKRHGQMLGEGAVIGHRHGAGETGARHGGNARNQAAGADGKTSRKDGRPERIRRGSAGRRDARAVRNSHLSGGKCRTDEAVAEGTPRKWCGGRGDGEVGKVGRRAERSQARGHGHRQMERHDSGGGSHIDGN